MQAFSNGAVEQIEGKRLLLQGELDAERTLLERNQMGQFATPPALASEIMSYAINLHQEKEVSFLEPSCGSGAFFSALLQNLGGKNISKAVGFELDSRFAQVATSLWRSHGLRVIDGDFTSAETEFDASASLLVANPPYVRHHHLTGSQKNELRFRCSNQLGIRPSGLSGLYLYFMLLSHRLLASGAVSAWLIPSEFMDVNYGVALKEYLTHKVQLIRVHQYDSSEAQFGDALVTSSVIVFRNFPPTPENSAEFSFGGTLSRPRVSHKIKTGDLKVTTKWSRYIDGSAVAMQEAEDIPRLSDFFRIRRGLATGSNGFFILSRAEAQRVGIQDRFLRPIIPAPRNLRVTRIEADEHRWPDIPDQLALIDCSLPIEEVRQENPELASYLEGADEKVRNGYLVSKRSPWYKQEAREAAPILLTYMGRGKDGEAPLRFILNKSEAVATNVYLMLYPTDLLQSYLSQDPERIEKVYQALLDLTPQDIREGGRVYGGGMHKMEPKELAALPAHRIASLDGSLAQKSADKSPLRSSGKTPQFDKKNAGEVRSWARKNGFQVSDRGRLRPEIWDAWRRAQHADASNHQNPDPTEQTALW
ncbi:histone-like nucleoid-structuring protein Lsr2 [Nocardiopsis sp. CC223A]|uniref:Eco57I restriction-modification methylase domain-containing protein n=1 Tax=Nocardiopsis sp. CC223A TaxID=3044051 RepID=UPI00278C084A|nr:histone-like nucleoid-structuring protein Lsr2 [Nocardiopsis sp. CC223A]